METNRISDIEGSELATGRVRVAAATEPDWLNDEVGASKRGSERVSNLNFETLKSADPCFRTSFSPTSAGGGNRGGGAAAPISTRELC